MHANKRRRLAVEDLGVLPLDLLEAVLTQADVQTKRACALASRALRQPLMTGRCWPNEVRLDLHDSRQLRWLQQHITVVERLGICLEYSLIGRFNRLLRHRGAPHLTSLSIHMTPDYMEEIRMHVFELRGLRLSDLRLHHGGWTPVISTHHLPTTLRSLAFADLQLSDKQVFFGGPGVWQCLALDKERVAWSFARQLPASVTRLRLMCTKEHLLGGLETLKQCCNLEELDIDVASNGPEFENPAGSESDVEKIGGCGAVALADAFSRLHLKRVGLHASTSCECVCLHDPNIAEMHRRFYFNDCDRVSIEDQVSRGSRQCVTKLTLHPYCTPLWPTFSLFPALKELIIGDTFEAFCYADLVPLSLTGLEVVAKTLTHLTMSSSREETYIELPQGLRLRSFVCVCSGTLHLHCDPHTLSQGLGDVLLGYTTIAGTGAKLVEDLSPRLGAAVLEVCGSRCRRYSLQFTRAGLVGKWWYRVFEVSKQQVYRRYACCRVRMWAEGRLCPPYLTFLRFGIVSAHDDRDVLCYPYDEPRNTWSP